MRELRKETETMYSIVLSQYFHFIRNERTPKGDGNQTVNFSPFSSFNLNKK